MSLVFADTYYFLARINRSDPGYLRTVRLSRHLRRPMVTTEWVLTEVADALSHPRHRWSVSNFYDAVRHSPAITIVPASHDLFVEGMFLYSQRRDKDWPLTDCISFVVMEDEGITEALTADHHFEQAGFTILLKE
jgi:hypothetical protein